MSGPVSPTIDLRNRAEVEEYFARLERNYPELVNTIRILGMSYQQYLAALQAMQVQSYSSAVSSRIHL